jgi:hypothetical protein
MIADRQRITGVTRERIGQQIGTSRNGQKLCAQHFDYLRRRTKAGYRQGEKALPGSRIRKPGAV